MKKEGRKKQARSNKQQVYMYMCTLHPSVCRGPFHRERRRYLRTALSELHQLLGDSPGLCGPKVHVYTSLYWYKCREFHAFSTLAISRSTNT